MAAKVVVTEMAVSIIIVYYDNRLVMMLVCFLTVTDIAKTSHTQSLVSAVVCQVCAVLNLSYELVIFHV